MKFIILASMFLLSNSTVTQWAYDFTHDQSTFEWQIVNDSVMGGRSQSEVSYTKHGLQFSGVLSLENNGGFASTRSRVLNTMNHDAIYIEVKGDGRVYQLRFRPKNNPYGIAYSARFQTTDTWQTLKFTPSDFQPVFRGRRVLGAPDFSPEDMTAVGIMLADKRKGTFSVTLRRLYQASPSL